MKVGLDIGGTKTEAVAVDADGSDRRAHAALATGADAVRRRRSLTRGRRG